MDTFKHGGEIFKVAKQMGIDVDEIVDFSANINPLGPPICVKKAILDVMDHIFHYPETPPISLIGEASRFYNVAPEEILFGNGSTELLYLLPKITHIKQAVIVVPSYVDYERVCILNKIDTNFLYLKEEDDFTLNSISKFNDLLKKPSLVFIGQPNNPTGKTFSVNLLKELSISNPDCLFVIDEAFGDFVDGIERMYENRPQNVVVLISLTKFYAIAGVRLGLIIGDKKIISKMKDILPPWSVNTFSQRIGELIFEDTDYIQKSKQYIKKQREELFLKLKSIPQLCPYNSDANFILCKIKSKELNASQLKKILLKKHILIRDCSNYRGLNNKFFRVAVKGERENNYLIECLKDVFCKKSRCGQKIYYSRYNKTSQNTPTIMFVGTCSNAGKSILAAGLCRILFQDGLKVAPFKAQNMSLNSYVTKDGKEMGRAQVLQAQACKLDPDARMNPVLLKPSSDTGSQVIVLGKPVGNMDVKSYIQYKKQLLSVVRETYDSLADEFDVIVMEGAGSPAEVNLKSHDITNMEMARYAQAKTLLVGDIDRGGVFASFIGTMQILKSWEKRLIKGFIINKFRGDASLLDSATIFTQKITGKPFLGIVPYIKNLGLPEEDSVSFKMGWDKIGDKKNADIKIACIDLPHISNFTDLDPLLMEPDVSLKIIKNKEELIDEDFDAIIIPGSKNVINDNEYLKKSSIADTLKYIVKYKNSQLIGICGGFQIIGNKIFDPYNIESNNTSTEGLSFLPIITELDKDKTLMQSNAVHTLSNLPLKGYEIHHGRTVCDKKEEIMCVVVNERGEEIGYGTKDMKVWGSYLHGIFDEDRFRRWFIDTLREKKGLSPLKEIQARYDIEENLDRLANILREHLLMDEIYRLLKLK